jgi:SAM-dependent methyltransferase
MAEHDVRFADGAAYERNMGTWSRLAGEVFLDWLAPASGLQWIDIGCGSGAFTELLFDRCAPAEVQGIDPSAGQLAFARARSAARVAEFRQGNATALPFAEDRFDAAVMALVIFFVPDPAKGVAEMVRAVVPGGLVASYAWDMAGGFPMGLIQAEMRTMGLNPPRAPSCGTSRMDTLRELWTAAGLQAVETRESRYREHLLISTTFGRRACWGRPLPRSSPQCRRGTPNSLKSGCECAYRRMPQVASPTLHGLTPLWVVNRNKNRKRKSRMIVENSFHSHGAKVQKESLRDRPALPHP